MALSNVSKAALIKTVAVGVEAEKRIEGHLWHGKTAVVTLNLTLISDEVMNVLV